jgi:nucleotide-binding universal stress UspA family protein
MQRILVPLDGTYLSQQAVKFAVILAQRWKGSIELFHWAPPGAIGRAPADEREAAQQVYATAAELRSDGVNVETTIEHVAHGNLAGAIADAVAARPIELIVMSTHGQAGVIEGLFGSHAEQVARGVDVPVLIVPTSHSGPWTETTQLRVLVPLDGSDVSEGAIEPAFKATADFHGAIILLRIVEPTNEAGDAGALTRATEHARRYLSEIATRLEGRGVLIEQLVEVGSFLDALGRVAHSERADLIAMGTHARQGFLRLLQGSDTEAVLNQTSVPVMVVPSGAAH